MGHGRQIKVAVAGMMHETNTFAPGLTTLDNFQDEWVEGLAAFEQRYTGTRTSMGGVLSKAKRLGIQVVPGLYAAATPSAMVTSDAAEKLFEAVLQSIEPDVDGMVIILHGAMVAEGFPDVEGELLRRLRVRFGRDLPIAVTLDLHGNISRDMVELADFLVGYDTYPHVDMFERAEEALELLCRLIEGKCQPVRALVKPNMLVVPQTMLTSEGAMKELMEKAFAVERLNGVLNVTIAGGFPYSDVADAGMAFIVTTDGDARLAKEQAERLCAFAWQRRERFQAQFTAPEEAICQAEAMEQGPIILAEGSDNVGGGAPADATHLLALLTNPSHRTLFVLCDADAAKQAHELGTGGRFSGTVGGKNDTLHGNPVQIDGIVRLLFDGVYHHVGPYMTGQKADMGKTAVVESGNLTLVLTEKRTAPWDLGHVRSLGLWPEDFHMIVVKSAIAWQAAFGPYAKAVVQVDTPGCCTGNLTHLTYHQLSRPIYPLDEHVVPDAPVVFD